jgi:predicted esterase
MLRALLVILFLAVRLGGGEPGPRAGGLEPRIVCARDPRYSYALYLPSAYTPDRRWPVLLAFAPDADGLRPVELFREEAERLGWIVAGSLESRNGALEPALQAQRAMWDDLHARFSVDPKRVVTAGFSGGARMALRLALDRPGEVMGVISFGAFHAWGRDIPFGLRLHAFLACGEEDFNYLEMRQAQRGLVARGQRVWWEVHAGGHRWPPGSVAARALGFMAILGAQGGLSAPDPGLEPRWAGQCLTEARARLRTDSRLSARRSLEALARFLPKEASGAAAAREAAALAADPACEAEAAAESAAEHDARRVLAARDSARYLGILRDLAEEARAAKGPAARHKAMLLKGETFVLEDRARASWAGRDFKRCALEFEALADLEPERALPPYFAACAWSQAKDAQRGLKCLRKSMDRGFSDWKAMKEDPNLEFLRGLPEFRALAEAP